MCGRYTVELSPGIYCKRLKFTFASTEIQVLPYIPVLLIFQCDMKQGRTTRALGMELRVNTDSHYSNNIATDTASPRKV
jgi:hypothetical protein